LAQQLYNLKKKSSKLSLSLSVVYPKIYKREIKVYSEEFIKEKV